MWEIHRKRAWEKKEGIFACHFQTFEKQDPFSKSTSKRFYILSYFIRIYEYTTIPVYLPLTLWHNNQSNLMYKFVVIFVWLIHICGKWKEDRGIKMKIGVFIIQWIIYCMSVDSFILFEHEP